MPGAHNQNRVTNCPGSRSRCDKYATGALKYATTREESQGFPGNDSDVFSANISTTNSSLKPVAFFQP